MNKPVIAHWNSWKAFRKTYVLINIRFELVLYGVTLFAVDAMMFLNPLSYDFTFGFLGFGIYISEKDSDPQ